MTKSGFTSLVFLQSVILFTTVGIANAQPKITNFDISPNEIGFKTEVTISFDYENVEGGLKEAKAFLIQKFQFPGEDKIIARTSNWQVYLENMSTYTSESGRFEKKFMNPDRWMLPRTELTYELKIIDKNGRESDIQTTKVTPKN